MSQAVSHKGYQITRLSRWSSRDYHHVAGETLYVSDSASDVRAALVEAVERDADLGGAYLGGANATSRKCRRCGCLEQVRAAREEAEAN